MLRGFAFGMWGSENGIPSPLEDQGGPFWVTEVCLLSVCDAVLCLWRGVTHRQLRVYAVFCAVSVSGTMWSAMRVPLENAAFSGNASLQPADPCIAQFLEHPTAQRLPVHGVIHAGQKVPAILGIGRSWTLNELCLELVPQKRNLRETDLGNTVVETRLCRAKLSCGDHRPACTRATARCAGARAPCCAVGRNVLVHHFDPLLTVDFQAMLHEVQGRCNVKSAHDARSHHSSRGRRL